MGFWEFYLLVGITATAALVNNKHAQDRFFAALYGAPFPGFMTAAAILWLVVTWPVWVARVSRF